MSTILIFIAALLACSLLAIWRFRVKSRRGSLPWISAFQDAQTRKLLPEERSAVENYLDNLSQIQQVPGPTGASAAPISLTLNAESNSVVILTHSITRYGITTDDPNKWRYYLDSVEVHLPPFWEQYINDENNVELILTDTLPLVISLNGHTLQEYMQESRGYALQNTASTQASIRGEESEQIELLNIRQETHEEYALSRPAGLREALLIVASFLLFFFCLITPDVFVPWMIGGAILLLAAGLWGLLRRRRKARCGKFTVCGERPAAGDCLGRIIRSRLTIFRWASSTLFTLPTGNLTLRRILGNKRILIFTLIAMSPARAVFYPCMMK